MGQIIERERLFKFILESGKTYSMSLRQRQKTVILHMSKEQHISGATLKSGHVSYKQGFSSRHMGANLLELFELHHLHRVLWGQ